MFRKIYMLDLEGACAVDITIPFPERTCGLPRLGLLYPQSRRMIYTIYIA